MNQKTKYLTLDTHSRASKWYMGYGSVLLRLGGVRSQRRNGYKNMIVEMNCWFYMERQKMYFNATGVLLGFRE